MVQSSRGLCSASITLFAVFVAALRFSNELAYGAEPAVLKLDFPRPHQVTQRIGVAPGAGDGLVLVRGQLSSQANRLTWEYRIIPLAKEATAASDWTALDVRHQGANFDASARVAAGGWYRLEVRCRAGDDLVAAGTVEPIGVGEVFIVAGQSYATNCNDEQLRVTDPQARVVAFDWSKETWAVANDPQPAPDGSDGGSIWPPLGDALAKELRVPIGFANVGVGATSSAQWLPEGDLSLRLVKAGQTFGRFRAVLWQQGESDVIAKTSLEQYVTNLTTIRESSAKAWQFEPPWLLAKSTLHPTVYNDPEGESRIRRAIDELLKRPAFKAGPDTDTLQGENRGDLKSRRHFSAIGQRRAAEMWFTAIREFLKSAL